MADGDLFSRLATSLDPPMVIVTTVAGGERAGCLVGFHAQCSIEPLRYVVWLSKANHTCRVAMRASSIAVHFLDHEQRPLAELFGTTSGDDTDKFQRCEWDPGPDGAPLLRACPTRLVGRRAALLDEGSDHVCLVLEVLETQVPAPFAPLRLSDVQDLDAGHETTDRPDPPPQRAPGQPSGRTRR